MDSYFGNAAQFNRCRPRSFPKKIEIPKININRNLFGLFFVLFSGVLPMSPVGAQSSNPSFVLVPPIFDVVDDNSVSLTSGKVQIDIPLLKMGSVSYTEYGSTALATDWLYDENYGHVVQCLSVSPNLGYGGSGECAVSNGYAIQAVVGKSRSTFNYVNGQYVSAQGTGEKFVDNGNGYCTLTKKDGTQVIFYGYHATGVPVCQSQSISKIIYPNGKVADYYYYGAISNSTRNPLLAIATSDGFLLKYNYSGTPEYGSPTSIVAVNRAFQTCNPAATTCTLSGAWPQATMSSQVKTMSVSDGFPSYGGYNGYQHHIVTLTDQRHRKYVFETDSDDRIITYQPPGSDTPVYHYKLCSLLADPNPSDVSWPMRDCFGQTNWRLDAPADEAPTEFDTVESVTRNGKVWSYGRFPTGPDGYYPPFHRWTHTAASPLGVFRSATGNSTPGTEYRAGPIDVVTNADGSHYDFAASSSNAVVSYVAANGAVTNYAYDTRTNLVSVTQHPASGTAPAIVRTAAYPASCATLLTCNEPSYVIDANGNRTDYTYDSRHGGVLIETRPAVNGVRPQKRYTYVQRYAWYLNASGVMTRETRPIWLLASESYCRTGAASGSGCALANDEVVTTYDYGPDSGPNNLLLRGITVTADGQTHRTCFGHDRYGNKIWERSPNAGMTSCPAY
jgi:YD repeat-containing protein